MYKYKKGENKYIDALMAHRQQQLTMYVRKPLRARLRLIWLKLIVIVRKIEYELKK